MNEYCTVILVNWNGWEDTIECLESIIRQDYLNIDVIIVDNNSSDDSVERIRQWSENQGKINKSNFLDIFKNNVIGHKRTFIELEKNEISGYKLKRYKDEHFVFLLKNDINAGFSKANNLAISFAIGHLETKYIFLLNNDTVLEQNTISRLIKVKSHNPDYSAIQAAIFYYHDPQKVWNLGGKILPWAQIKYYRELENISIKQINFLSGCALFFEADLIEKVGLLTENFFHGEEDFEFSMRLKQKGIKAGVVFGAKVYHKIGVSVSKKWDKGEQKIINFALNRMVDMRNYFSHPSWKIWKIFATFYFFYLMIAYYKIPLSKSIKIGKLIYSWSSKLKVVDQKTIQHIMDELNA